MRSFVQWLWILSGVPVGIVLIMLPPGGRFVCFTLFVLLETAHSLSPIVLAWTHGDFRRQVILPQAWKYVVLPSAVFVGALAVGVVTSLGWTSLVYGPGHLFLLTDWTNPLPMVVWVYWVWNIYHFGMQHFGVLSLWRGVPGHRYRDMGLCLGVTAFVMAVLPWLTHDQWVNLLMVGAISVNHWVVDIGLSSRAAKWGWLFVCGVLVVGAVGFLWMIPTSNGMLIRVIPVVIGARVGLGFVHFLYSRWVWKFSDPQVRATIGRDLVGAVRA